jgi:uncharacterized protein (TIGR02594 family)
MSRHPDFPGIQRRLKALGLYDFPIDDVFGPGMSSGVDQALTLLERAHADLAPKPASPALPPPPAPPAARNPLMDTSLPKVPAQYAWLRDAGVLPRHLTIGLNLIGTTETPGAANNPIIMNWAKVCRDAGVNVAGFTADSVPWCGLFMAYVMVEAGRTNEAKAIGGTLWALNWSKFGVDGGQPELGDILTFTRNGGGHVGIYIGEDTGYFHLLGGNQSDRVNIMRIAKSRMHRCRQPRYINKPRSATVRILSAVGAISTNEA